jgi:hypothetical protein
MLTMQSALWWAPGLEPGSRRSESQLRSARSSDRTKVSGLSLRKTGIIGSLARDFWAFDGPTEPKGSVETEAELGNAAVCGPFASFLVVMSVPWNAWLGREDDSNLEMANWKSDTLACPRETAEPLSVEIHK